MISSGGLHGCIFNQSWWCSHLDMLASNPTGNKVDSVWAHLFFLCVYTQLFPLAICTNGVWIAVIVHKKHLLDDNRWPYFTDLPLFFYITVVSEWLENQAKLVFWVVVCNLACCVSNSKVSAMRSVYCDWWECHDHRLYFGLIEF